jgi:hypothetical protein
MTGLTIKDIKDFKTPGSNKVIASQAYKRIKTVTLFLDFRKKLSF